MARTVQELGPGGPQRAARALRWGRMTIRTGLRALARGGRWSDAFTRRGRKRAEEPLPHLLPDRCAIGDGQSQAAPPCRSQRRSPRLTAAEVRRQWMAQKGDLEAPLPPAATSGTTLNARGDYPQKVAKSQPQKHSQTPTLSSTQSLSAIMRPIQQTQCYASRWMPQRRSKSARLRGVARAASRRLPPPMPFTQRRPCPPWAAPCRRWMNCFCRGSPLK